MKSKLDIPPLINCFYFLMSSLIIVGAAVTTQAQQRPAIPSISSLSLKKTPLKDGLFKNILESKDKKPLEIKVEKKANENEISSSVGTNSGGGGDSAFDKNDGTRKLLDLIERDDLEYFFPEIVLKKVSSSYDASKIYELLFRLGRASSGIKYQGCSKNPTIDQTKMSTYGSPKFLVTLSLSYDWSILNDSIDHDNWCLKTDYDRILASVFSSLEIKPVTTLRWAFTDETLEEINDEGVIKIQNPESKKQLAIQKDNFVLINKKEFMRLDDESKEALFLHESVLHAVLLLNPKHVKDHGTQFIRNYVRQLLKFYKNNDTVPGYIVSDAFNLLELN
ncbi:MAG: hypothetical protein WA160_16160 [Pseudobdellovibrio sp.]